MGQEGGVPQWGCQYRLLFSSLGSQGFPGHPPLPVPWHHGAVPSSLGGDPSPPCFSEETGTLESHPVPSPSQEPQ